MLEDLLDETAIRVALVNANFAPSIGPVRVDTQGKRRVSVFLPPYQQADVHLAKLAVRKLGYETAPSDQPGTVDFDIVEA